MPVATVQLFRVIDRQLLQDEEVLNVYWYSNEDPLNTYLASQIAGAFISNVIPQITAIQNAAITHEEVEVDDVLSITNFHTASAGSIPGTGGGEVLPKYVTSGIRFQRTTKETRNGYKRWSGIQETNITNGVYTAGFITALQTLGTFLIGNTQLGLATPVEPVIVRRPTPPATDYIFNLIGAAVPYGPTTQNSRKR